MSTPALRLTDIPVLQSLNRSDVAQTLAGLKRFLKRSLWVGTSNFYAREIATKLGQSPPNTNIRQRNLAQYVAASVALHANDGWSYLARSVSSLLAGDTHRGLHLAYYAELRAAMSILASTGIGIFKSKHYVLSGINTMRQLATREGTHVMTWLALKNWAGQPASGALFASLVRPEGLTLEEWFKPQGGSGALAPQAQAWFMQWGMDLSLATNDRDARNESSYRPDGIPETWAIDAPDALEFVHVMWGLLEPSAGSQFEQLDRHILRLAIEKAYTGRTGRPPRGADAGYISFINGIIKPQNLAKASEDRLRDFLLRNTAPMDPLIFSHARVKPIHRQSDVFAVMSRAVFLLRIATGSAQELLGSAGFASSDLDFWLARLGESRGLWPPGSPPSPLVDLWADVDDSMKEIDAIKKAEPDSFANYHAIAMRIPGPLSIFSSHERVGLWGICPT